VQSELVGRVAALDRSCLIQVFAETQDGGAEVGMLSIS
jgi:hypothetical protein